MGNPLPVNLSAECRKADKIIKEFVDPVNGLDRVIPLTVLRRAKGFAIFSIFRVGFVLTARAGSGVVIAKLPDGSWSAPSALGIAGVGGGFSAGAEVTDFIVVLNSRSAVKSFMATGSLQLGGNMSLAVGPLGRSAEASGSLNSSGEVAAMFSYSKSQGLFGGVSLEGTALVDRSDANSKAYNRSITAKKILSGSVEVPAFAQGLIGTIERLSLTGRMAAASRADEIEPGAGRDSWEMDSDGAAETEEYYARPRTERASSKNNGLENYFSQAELDSRQRKYERDQLTGAYTRSTSYGGDNKSLASAGVPSSTRRSPPPPVSRPPMSSSSSSSNPFATADDDQDAYSLDRDNATRNAGTYSFSSQSGASMTNTPRGETPGSGRKRSDSKASFKGAAGYFDDLLPGNKDRRSYSPIIGKQRPSAGHRKNSSSFSIPKLGRKTPPAFGNERLPRESLIPTSGPDSGARFNEKFRESSEEDSNSHGFSSVESTGWQREVGHGTDTFNPASASSTFGAPDYDAAAERHRESQHRPKSSRKGSSGFFSFVGGGSSNNGTPLSGGNGTPTYPSDGGLRKTTPADAIRAAAAAAASRGDSDTGRSKALGSNDAFSDIWDAEKARASSTSYSNTGLDTLDQELQGNDKSGWGNAPASMARSSSNYKNSSSGNGGFHSSFSDDRPSSSDPVDRYQTSTSRFSPVNFFRTNSGGVKSAASNSNNNNNNNSSRTGSGLGFRSASGGGFRSGSGSGFRTSSRNSSNNEKSSSNTVGGGFSNFVGMNSSRSKPNGLGAPGNSHLLSGSSSEGEEDDYYHGHNAARRANNISEISTASTITREEQHHDHENDWGLSNLDISPPSSSIEKVIASFDFAGQESDDLRFNRGDVITVLKKTDSTNDWWLGKTADGRIGSFPANFVEAV
ncbi:unnamed protein product [Sympodiomycopsis kandeliae]